MPDDAETLSVAALYCFSPLPDCADLGAPLETLCAELGIRGTLLLAPEGINGTVAGPSASIDGLVARLRHGWIFGERLAKLSLRLSSADAMPFGRLKVKVKREIVAFDGGLTDPARRVGTHVAPAEWNAVIREPGTVLIDTRNGFEVAMGSFAGATDPATTSFGGFRDFVARHLDPVRDRRIAMFCTGGIRCEKASAYLLDQGFAEVLHLKGGILAYLAEVPQAQSLWRGGCFVFDGRGALGHGLVALPMADAAVPAGAREAA